MFRLTEWQRTEKGARASRGRDESERLRLANDGIVVNETERGPSEIRLSRQGPWISKVEIVAWRKINNHTVGKHSSNWKWYENLAEFTTKNNCVNDII